MGSHPPAPGPRRVLLVAALAWLPLSVLEALATFPSSKAARRGASSR
jgi:hypothetical protein